MSEELTVQDRKVVAIEYTLTVDGEVLDSSIGHDPLEFLQGYGDINPGLENELYDMNVGKRKRMIVAAIEGYGEIDPASFILVPRSQFPENIPMDVGTLVQVHDQDGHDWAARINHVEADSVRLDFTHPLAGKELKFDVKIVSVRETTKEELNHRHVHGEGQH